MATGIAAVGGLPVDTIGLETLCVTATAVVAIAKGLVGVNAVDPLPS